MKREYLLTSESVSGGHPDKMADQISDAVLDVFITADITARVACETLITRGLVVVSGEISSYRCPTIPHIVRRIIRNTGYTDPDYGFDYRTCGIIVPVNTQSRELSRGIKLGAGDQVTVFGYATNETPELMPLGISLAHKLVHRQATLRESGKIKWLRPDAKAQVTVRYIDAKPVSVEKVVLSTQHCPSVSSEQIKNEVVEEIIEKVIPGDLKADDIEYLVNPGGPFTIGGPMADTGLTGRKIMVDTYGPGCPHGGGAFSGKDPTKLDRSGAYMARYIAKNIVAADLAERCTIQLSYAPGIAEPVSLTFDLHGTGKIDEEKLEDAVRQIFKLTPQGIISMLRLNYPIYRKTAVYGHFGRELPEFTWERTDQAGKLRDYFGIPQDAPINGNVNLGVKSSAGGWHRMNQNLEEIDHLTPGCGFVTSKILYRSKSSFEVDFKKFLKSKYAENRVVLRDSFVSHLAVQHCAIPPINQVLESEHEYLKPSSSKACLQMLKYESDRYICVTMNSHFTNPEAIQGEIDDTFRDKTPDIPFQLDPTNSGQMYIAVIHFTSKYVFQTHLPYSHITVHRIDDKMKTSRLVARFEDGEELTISDRL